MGHAFVYVFAAICGLITAQETTTEFYTTTDSAGRADGKITKGNDTPTSEFAVPGKPTNLTVLDFTSSSIYLQWANPLKKNGMIEGYRVYYITNNITKPLTEYTISVKPFTQKHEGAQSESVMATTDIGGPSAPRVLNLRWERPKNFFYSIDYYYVYINLGNRLYNNITISASKDHLETTYTLKNVTTDTYYHVQIQASREAIELAD
ncbi:hypothetical protein NQ318_003533 [Aromia moschata]|uniref:Fibronectin type-III domain-containing protein n=1 Tax=Aromia moschata TaxID=1265417 RepID=A0AAV8YV69_9CUCU|nr:hypothetical protein NQ318_003533 [Aromia moschata]